MKPEPLFETYGYPVYEPETAAKLGYESLTIAYQTDHKNPYIRKHENELWELQCYTMIGCNAVAVVVENGFEMWRHTSELNIDPKTGMKCSRYISKTRM